MLATLSWLSGSLQEEVLKEVAVKVRKEREQQEARVGDSTQRAAQMATKNSAVKQLRRLEVRALVSHAGVLACMWRLSAWTPPPAG